MPFQLIVLFSFGISIWTFFIVSISWLQFLTWELCWSSFRYLNIFIITALGYCLLIVVSVSPQGLFLLTFFFHMYHIFLFLHLYRLLFLFLLVFPLIFWLFMNSIFWHLLFGSLIRDWRMPYSKNPWMNARHCLLRLALFSFCLLLVILQTFKWSRFHHYYLWMIELFYH